MASHCLSGEVVLPTTVEAFETYMNGFVGKRPPGLSIAIAVGDELIYTQGFGLAEIERQGIRRAFRDVPASLTARFDRFRCGGLTGSEKERGKAQ